MTATLNPPPERNAASHPKGLARLHDAPLANHSDPTIAGCRGVTNCTAAATKIWATIDGLRQPKGGEEQVLEITPRSRRKEIEMTAELRCSANERITLCSAEITL